MLYKIFNWFHITLNKKLKANFISLNMKLA
jgi:hypothetical protein